MYKKGLIDTNILVYATNRQSSFHQKAKQFLDEILIEGNAVFTPQIFYEFFNVISADKETTSLNFIIETIRYYLNEIQVPLVHPLQNTHYDVFNRVLQTNVIRRGVIYDFLLAETILANGISTIYTHNGKDFEIYEDIEIIDPVK